MQQVKRYLTIVQTPESDNVAWGVFVPDIPGCFSAGDTLDEALVNVHEAIALQIEGILEIGGKIPESTDMSNNPANNLKQNETAYIVDFDLKCLHGKSRIVSITVPEGILHQIDAAAKRCRLNRSAFFTEAALEKIRAGYQI